MGSASRPTGFCVGLILYGVLCGPAVPAGTLGKGIVLPEDAQGVSSLRWREITSMTPLSRELVLVRTRERPYLLTLKRACPGLRSDSIFMTEQENGHFEPQRDLLRAAPPPNSGIGPIALNGSGEFTRNGLTQGAVRCRPDALFATSEDGVEWVEAMLEEQRGKKKRRRKQVSAPP